MRWRDVKQGKKATQEEIKDIKPLHPIASIFDRLKAFLTDTFMILMPLMYFVFYIVMGSREGFEEHMLLGWVYILIPHMIITILFWKIKGQTPGYKAYNLKITTYEGISPSILQLIVRYICFGITFLSIFGLFIPFLTKNKRGIYDILSKTQPTKI